MPIPENLISLHQGEEEGRQKSLSVIAADRDLQTHLFLIERSMDLIEYFSRRYKNENDDQLTIQLLGIRLFNGAASAIKLLLSGYYQTSALQQRDLLETIFLIDYFSTYREQISVWRTSDEKTRMKSFKPVNIRKALDERDGFTERKREAAYDLLCRLAGHATFDGFRMLTPIPGGDAHCGPFIEPTALKAVTEELAKKLFEAGGVFTLFFKARNGADIAMKDSFAAARELWVKHFYGMPLHEAATQKCG